MPNNFKKNFNFNYRIKTSVYNKLYVGGRQDMPPPLSSPVGAEAPRAVEQTAT